MLFPRTPHYDGPNQPDPCSTQPDHHVMRWVSMLVGALFPSAPAYDTAPHEPGGDKPPVPSPPKNGAPMAPDLKQAALAQLLHLLFVNRT